jgi:hypothetical protein
MDIMDVTIVLYIFNDLNYNEYDNIAFTLVIYTLTKEIF